MTKERGIQYKIISDRLNLDLLTVDDFDFLQTLVNTKGWIENIGDRNIHSKNEAITYINKILATENFYYWVVRTKDAKTPVGIISILKRSYLEHFDIGFAFLPDFTNQGYAFEAAKAILLMLSRLPEFKTVLATTLYSNKNSIKLLKKLGFRFEKENEIENANMHIYTNAPYIGNDRLQ
jgi:RimJ/RimL family protein N-acetyltransferase